MGFPRVRETHFLHRFLRGTDVPRPYGEATIAVRLPPTLVPFLDVIGPPVARHGPPELRNCLEGKEPPPGYESEASAISRCRRLIVHWWPVVEDIKS